MTPDHPEKWLEFGRQFHAEGRVPAEPRNAATVVLLRQGSAGPEVYMMSRVTSMAFAAGMSVFPGGSSDAGDRDDELEWFGPSAEQWAERLGTDSGLARALVVAAVRETFEEAGVLLAGPSGEQVVPDASTPEWEHARQALERHDASLGEVLVERGQLLRSDLVAPWSGWLTPEFEPRRYRTWFFVAALPEGQHTRDASTESETAAWWPVDELIARYRAGQAAMFPPTYLTLLELARWPDVEQVLAEARSRTVEMFMPELTRDGTSLTMPGHLQELLA